MLAPVFEEEQAKGKPAKAQTTVVDFEVGESVIVKEGPFETLPPRSPRSSSNPRRSWCWCPSSNAKRRSTWRSTRSPRSDPTNVRLPAAHCHRLAMAANNEQLEEKEGPYMAPKKKVTGLIKLQIQAGAANPAPPIGPALGQHGVNIMEFCKAYNAATEAQRGNVIPVEITVYEDRSFTFITKTPPAAELIKKAAGVAKGSATPHTVKVAKLTQAQVNEIATDQDGRPQRQRPRSAQRRSSPAPPAPWASPSRAEPPPPDSRHAAQQAQLSIDSGRARAARRPRLHKEEERAAGKAQQSIRRRRREDRRGERLRAVRGSPLAKDTDPPSSTPPLRLPSAWALTPARLTRWSAAPSTCPTAPARPPASWSSPRATRPKQPSQPAPTSLAPTT